MKLTSADPEPCPGTVLLDRLGRPWYRAYGEEHDGWANWTRVDVEDDPESWVKVGGNYGPVTVTEWGEGDHQFSQSILP